MKAYVQPENPHANLQSSPPCVSLKLEMARVSLSIRERISCSVHMEWNAAQNVDTHNVDEFQKYYAAEWKKPFA